MLVGHVEGVAVKGHASTPALGVGSVDPEEKRVARWKAPGYQLRALGRDVYDQLKGIN